MLLKHLLEAKTMNPSNNQDQFLSAVQEAAWEKPEGVLVRVSVGATDPRLGGRGSYGFNYKWSFDTKPFTKDTK